MIKENLTNGITSNSKALTQQKKQSNKKTTYRMGENSANRISHKGLIFKTYKEVSQPNNKKNPIKSGEEELNRVSPKCTSKWPTDT